MGCWILDAECGIHDIFTTLDEIDYGSMTLARRVMQAARV